MKLLPIFHPSHWHELFFLKKKNNNFFPTWGSTVQLPGYYWRSPICSSSLSTWRWENPQLLLAHSEEAEPITRPHFPCLLPAPSPCQQGSCWTVESTTLGATSNEHSHPPQAAATWHFLFHGHRLNSGNTLPPWKRFCNFFTNSDSVHFHCENVLMFFKYCVSWYFYMALKSNLLKYGSCKNTNFWAILSYIITLHIGHNFLF